jgi:hypothetical protein
LRDKKNNKQQQQYNTIARFFDNLVALKGNEQFEKRRQTRNEMRIKKQNNKLSKEELTKLKNIEKQVIQDAIVHQWTSSNQSQSQV